MLPRTSRQAIARRNKVQHEQNEGNDATRLQVSHALPLIHHRGALEVAHGARRPVSRVAVGLLVRVAVGIGAREGDGDAAARACEAEVGPDAGTSLAGGFNAAGHVPLGEGDTKRVLGLGRVHRVELHFSVSLRDGASRLAPEHIRTAVPVCVGECASFTIWSLHSSVVSASCSLAVD
jgi:hypothetical protein